MASITTNIVYLTSGSGTTAIHTSKIIAEEQGIKIIGYIHEPNPDFTKTISNLQFSLWFKSTQQLEVKRDEYATSEEFHNSIFVRAKEWGANLIVLAGWMHIVPANSIGEANKNGITIINLHPTLQYQLIGRDIYPKIWQMYQDGMIRETGCFVHHVSPSVDRGELIHEMKLDLTQYSTFESYKSAMYGDSYADLYDYWTTKLGLEKKCVIAAINKIHQQRLASNAEPVEITPASFSKVNGLKHAHRGKVRDIYTSSYYDKYLFVYTSDRISANDIVISYLPGKGRLLNAINSFWHRTFNLSQMVATTDTNLMIVRKWRPIPLEIIVRRRITGSLWKLYSEQGVRVVNGYVLPEGLTDGDRFDIPIVTPTTKGHHDIPITFDEIVERGILNRAEVEKIRDEAVKLFLDGENFMKSRNIEMIDTKFEFAFTEDGKIKVIDEIFTPDSSRFIVDGVKMDKDILRKWTRQNEEFILSNPAGKDGCRNVVLPEEVASRLIANYREFYARLDPIAILGPGSEIQLATLDKFAVIIAGSKSDDSHVQKIRNELAKRDIISFVYFCSAHKNTVRTMEILAEYNSNTKSKIVFITCAGMSNALSGVIAANSKFPVIACPPFADRDDQMLNINSTLQMPSDVPTGTVLRPDNCASLCAKILNL
jgi:phosphoribosylaminoimidazole-succinocarboxamide synthase